MCKRKDSSHCRRPSSSVASIVLTADDSVTKSSLSLSLHDALPILEMCNNDAVCPGEMKCCSNGCGHTCQARVWTTLASAAAVVESPVVANVAAIGCAGMPSFYMSCANFGDANLCCDGRYAVRPLDR